MSPSDSSVTQGERLAALIRLLVAEENVMNVKLGPKPPTAEDHARWASELAERIKAGAAGAHAPGLTGGLRLKIGDAVTYVDEIGEERDALLTAVHGTSDDPSVNLVFVSADESQHDPYGRQISRRSSVVYQLNQGAHGNYWRHR